MVPISMRWLRHGKIVRLGEGDIGVIKPVIRFENRVCRGRGRERSDS